MSASTKGTVGIELIGVAKRATTAEPEALEPWVEMVWHKPFAYGWSYSRKTSR